MTIIECYDTNSESSFLVFCCLCHRPIGYCTWDEITTLTRNGYTMVCSDCRHQNKDTEASHQQGSNPND